MKRWTSHEMLDLVLDEGTFASWDSPPLAVAEPDSAYAVELAAAARRHVVGRIEETLVDLGAVDEVEDIDAPRLLERSRLEVVLRQHDELAALVLVALDEVLPRHRLAVHLGPAHRPVEQVLERPGKRARVLGRAEEHGGRCADLGAQVGDGHLGDLVAAGAGDVGDGEDPGGDVAW